METVSQKAAVLDSIKALTEDVGVPPTRRELSAKTNIPLATIQRLCEELEREGFITILPGMARGVLIHDATGA